MFEIKKTFEIACSHQLTLPYESKCSNLHGHNFLVTVYCRANNEQVNKNNGMVIDFSEVKRLIHDVLDHKNLNDIDGVGVETVFENTYARIKINPTAENLARWICFQIPHCYKVDVQESSGNVATYIDDSIQMRL